MPSAILVSLDCIRQDSLGCFGSQEGASRTIDALATQGTTFSQCITTAPYTPASHASVFTGMYPFRHGLRHIWGLKIKSEVPTLAEMLREHSIATGGFVAAQAMSSVYGLARGYDVYDEGTWRSPEQFPSPSARREGKEVTDSALAWLASLPANRPFFLFLHYYDAHAGPPAGEVSRSTQIKGLRKADRELRRLLVGVRRLHLSTECMVVIFSDHGESFGTHGKFGHRTNLYEELMLVPLVVAGLDATRSGIARPKRLHRDLGVLKILERLSILDSWKPFDRRLAEPRHWQCEELVSVIDIFPTVCDWFGVPISHSINGVTLLDVWRGKGTLDPHTVVYGEASVRPDDRTVNPVETKLYMARTSDRKLIIDTVSGRGEFYDLEADPDELNNLYALDSEEVRNLEDKLDGIIALVETDENVFSADEEEQIRSRLSGLGYT